MLRCLRIVFQDVFFTISVAVIGHKSHGKLTLFTKPLLYLSRPWVLKCNRGQLKNPDISGALYTLSKYRSHTNFDHRRFRRSLRRVGRQKTSENYRHGKNPQLWEFSESSKFFRECYFWYQYNHNFFFKNSNFLVFLGIRFETHFSQKGQKRK